MSTTILRFEENLQYTQTIFQQIIDYFYKVARLKKIVTMKKWRKEKNIDIGKRGSLLDNCVILSSNVSCSYYLSKYKTGTQAKWI